MVCLRAKRDAVKLCALVAVFLFGLYYVDIIHWWSRRFEGEHPEQYLQSPYSEHAITTLQNDATHKPSLQAKAFSPTSKAVISSSTLVLEELVFEFSVTTQNSTPRVGAHGLPTISDLTDSQPASNLGTMPIRTLFDNGKLVHAEQHPIQNLYFMKTHKTGSSTLQNILIRYAYNHNRTVGLPKRSVVFPSYFKGVKMSPFDLQEIPNGQNISMMMHHMRLNYDLVSSLLPPDAFYFTILRDPATLLKSEYSYFCHHTAAFRRASSFEDFARNISRYYHGKRDGRYWWFAQNPMTFDLGFDNQRDDDEYIARTLKKMDEMFDLVIIVEYFDVGVILLKEALHWKLEDIVYLSMNLQNASSPRLADDVTEALYDWNKADYALYLHYNSTFWSKVAELGRDKLEKELDKLNEMKRKLADECVEKEMVPNSLVDDPKFVLFHRKGVELMQYQLKTSQKDNETCIGLILPETQWWRKMSKLQEVK